MKVIIQIVLLLLVLNQFSLAQQIQNITPPKGIIPVSSEQSNDLQKQTQNHISVPQTQAILGWNEIGTVTTDTVTQSSIASDGSRLMIFYRRPVPSLNQDGGHFREWNGSSWDFIVTPTLECHDPDIAVAGNLVAASFSDDGNDYGFTSNINGPWVTLTGTLLQHQWGMNVAIAQNRPYMTFACRYSDGQPFSYMMLHVVSPLGPGPSAELKGGWSALYTDVGTDPAITGNSDAWYTAFRQGQNLYVKKGYVNTSGQSFIEDIGSGFTVNGNPYSPKIIIYSGNPVVAWLENSGLKLYVARWNGTSWMLLGEASRTFGNFYSVGAAVNGSDLYIIYVNNSGSPRISVNKWNGSEWSEIPGVLESDSTSLIATAEVAIWQSSPVVGFVENRRVKVFTTGTGSGTEQTEIPGIIFALSDNYPNPFNPSTKINYSVPRSSNIVIKIYDILGNEIETLVDEEKPAGNYELIWNAANHPSGIYFYQLRTENFVETKKMILMK